MLLKFLEIHNARRELFKNSTNPAGYQFRYQLRKLTDIDLA